jgi:phosphate transport system permease protein
MSTVFDLMRPAPEPAPEPTFVETETPRRIDSGRTLTDRIFHGFARSIGLFVLLLTGSIGLFLGYQSIPTLHRYGLHFFTVTDWQPELDHIGIASVLLGTVTVALVALVVAFPLAFLTALFISEYAPTWLKPTLVSLVDLMAAIPSIVFGLWGFFFLQPHVIYISRWINVHFGWIPIFHVTDASTNAADWPQTRYAASAFIAGLTVSMMVVPLACAVMRGVFAQAPLGEREAAYALGATRWGMIRRVVLPFGRGGIIGGTMLGLGRALGETIAVLLIISPAFDAKIRPLEIGTETTSALIAGRFGEATAAQLSALLTAGFVLFLMTLLVNTAAAVFVTRSRSGATTEI